MNRFDFKAGSAYNAMHCFLKTAHDYSLYNNRSPQEHQAIKSDEFSKAITIRHLRIIAALAELKLVARVSESLNVTQPAASNQITELERIVGVPVVTRDKNRLHLTSIGIRLAEHAKQVLSQLDRAAFDLEAMASGISGSVSIGASVLLHPPCSQAR